MGVGEGPPPQHPQDTGKGSRMEVKVVVDTVTGHIVKVETSDIGREGRDGVWVGEEDGGLGQDMDGAEVRGWEGLLAVLPLFLRRLSETAVGIVMGVRVEDGGLGQWGQEGREVQRGQEDLVGSGGDTEDGVIDRRVNTQVLRQLLNLGKCYWKDGQWGQEGREGQRGREGREGRQGQEDLVGSGADTEDGVIDRRVNTKVLRQLLNLEKCCWKEGQWGQEGLRGRGRVPGSGRMGGSGTFGGLWEGASAALQ